MTEEFMAMTQTITEMARDELGSKGGCFIMYAHQDADDGQDVDTIKGACGKNIDLITGAIMMTVEILKQTPDQTARKAMALSMAMSIMKHVSDLEDDDNDH